MDRKGRRNEPCDAFCNRRPLRFGGGGRSGADSRTGSRPTPAKAVAPASMVEDLKVKEVGLAEIDTSHIKLAVDLNLTATQSVTMESLRIGSLHI